MASRYSGPVSAQELPLFPLHSVLFPGGELRLRLFEPRYLDLIGDCSRRGGGFGVCLIIEGEEAGTPALPAAFGTRAELVDFYTLDDGLLGITVRGAERFHVRRSRVRDNGLIVADVDWCGAAMQGRLQPEHGLLATLVTRLLERIGGAAAMPDQDQLDSPDWVGYRLAELLPLEQPERQTLLQMDDPNRRLDQLLQWLPRFQAE